MAEILISRLTDFPLANKKTATPRDLPLGATSVAINRVVTWKRATKRRSRA